MNIVEDFAPADFSVIFTLKPKASYMNWKKLEFMSTIKTPSPKKIIIK